MQRSGAVVARQPARDQPLRVLARAGLVHGVRERMSGVRVTGPQLVAALRQGAADRYVAVTRLGPAAVIEEIGRASCGERVCQYVELAVLADKLKKTNYNKDI